MLAAILRALARAVDPGTRASAWNPADSYEAAERAGEALGFQSRERYRRVAIEAYGGSVWVYRCIRELSEAVAQVSWIASAGTDALPESHPASLFLAAPSPGVTWHEWAETWTLYLYLAGDVRCETVTSGADGEGDLLAAELLNPGGLGPVPVQRAAESAPLHYVDPDTGIARSVAPESTVRWHFVSPLRHLAGHSPVTPVGETVSTDGEARRWAGSSFRNSAVPSGALIVPQGTRLQPKQRSSLQRMLREGFSGRNAFKSMLLEGGADWKPFGQSARDLEFEKLRRLSAVEICAAFGVPPWMVGASEPKYANYQTARTAYWLDTVQPLLDRLADGLAVLAARFWPGVSVRYNLDDTPAMTGTYSDRLDQATKLRDLGYPVNEINRRLGLGMEDQPWGDAGLLPATLAPASVLADEGPGGDA